MKDPKNRGVSFGISREFYKRVYYKENIPHDRAIPGPGTYYNADNHKVNRDSLQYSIRPKTDYNSSFVDHTKGFPGPGTYDLKQT